MVMKTTVPCQQGRKVTFQFKPILLHLHPIHAIEVPYRIPSIGHVMYKMLLYC